MRFAKLQALGNDFLVVEESDLRDGASPGALALAMCDRHFGAGADGLIVATASRDVQTSDWTSRIFNADGSEAEVSGNGTRCLAAYVDEFAPASLARRDEIRVSTAAGVKRLQFVERHGITRLIRMEMGAPIFCSAEVPFACDPPLERVVDYPLDVAGSVYAVTVLSVGNPHCSVFVHSTDDLDPSLLGPAIERHALFPNRVNVEFVEVVDRRRINVRFWERGVGTTMSSGTGASAAVVAAALSDRTERDAIVATPAGELGVTWRADDDVVLLTGPAEIVYSADWMRDNG